MIQFVPQYLVAVIGMGVGAAAGIFVAAAILPARGNRFAGPDAWITAPLLLAAAGAHLALIPVVEPQRQMLFGLYGVALLVTVALGAAGWRIWRLGAVLLPLGSILAYGYFAGREHEADVVGLVVKVVELAAIGAAAWPVLSARRQAQDGRRSISTG
jgi:hypothetical protein